MSDAELLSTIEARQVDLNEALDDLTRLVGTARSSRELAAAVDKAVGALEAQALAVERFLVDRLSRLRPSDAGWSAATAPAEIARRSRSRLAWPGRTVGAARPHPGGWPEQWLG